MKSIVGVLCSIFSLLCYSQEVDSLFNRITQTTVEDLNNTTDHILFLENVFNLDQGIRQSVSQVEQVYGRESAEYDSIFTEWMVIDRFLFKKIVNYLAIHPHPTNEFGEIACMTPQLIFHHAAGTNEDLELKLKFLPVFYSAYSNGELNSSTIWFYLFRLYQQVNEKEMYFISDISESEQIKAMYLELTHSKE